MSKKGKRGRLHKRDGFGKSVDRRLRPRAGRRQSEKRATLMRQFAGK